MRKFSVHLVMPEAVREVEADYFEFDSRSMGWRFCLRGAWFQRRKRDKCVALFPACRTSLIDATVSRKTFFAELGIES